MYSVALRLRNNSVVYESNNRLDCRRCTAHLAVLDVTVNVL